MFGGWVRTRLTLKKKKKKKEGSMEEHDLTIKFGLLKKMFLGHLFLDPIYE